MSSKRFDIVVFGDTCVDLILKDADVAPEFGQVEKLVADYDLEMGGSCCIFAAQAAKLGLKVALVGRVGADAFGQLIVDTLSAAGVDTRYIAVDSSLRTGITAHLVQGDDRAMLTHPGSLSAVTIADVTDELLLSARHLHYGSLYLQTGLLPHWVDILRRAKALGLTTSLDTNWDPEQVWDHGLARALPLIDVLLPNEQEAIHLSGQPSAGAAIAHLRRQVPLLVVKRDIAGALAWQGDGSFVQAVLPAVSRRRWHWRRRQFRCRVFWRVGWRVARADLPLDCLRVRARGSWRCWRHSGAIAPVANRRSPASLGGLSRQLRRRLRAYPRRCSRGRRHDTQSRSRAILRDCTYCVHRSESGGASFAGRAAYPDA